MTRLLTIFLALVGALTAHSVEENRAIAESRSARTFCTYRRAPRHCQTMIPTQYDVTIYIAAFSELEMPLSLNMVSNRLVNQKVKPLA